MNVLAWVIVGWLGINVLVGVLAVLAGRDDEGDAYDLLDRR